MVEEANCGCKMEFDLVAFTLSPTTEVFERCRKKDLLLIANFFNITVPADAVKHVIKQVLREKLEEMGILPESSAREEVSPDVAEGAVSDDGPPSVPVVEPSGDPLLAFKIKELDYMIKKQEHQTMLVKLRVIEAETDRDIRLRQLDRKVPELKRKPVPLPRLRSMSASSPSYTHSATPPQDSHEAEANANFDVSRYLKLVPPFRESEVDAYFVTFERIALKLHWPKDVWALLLQCSFSGKAQEVSSALPLEQSLDYDIVKAAVLRAYELVPEAYRQKFRSHAKTAKQTYVEFAREKRTLFEKWCLSNRITTFEQLQELILLEEFKSSVPENVVLHLNEQKVTSIANAAVLADEFTLTHRNVFVTPRRNAMFSTSINTDQDVRSVLSHTKPNTQLNSLRKKNVKRACFFCLDPNHIISECRAWKQKTAASHPKSVALVHTGGNTNCGTETVTSAYQPFLLDGAVSHSPDAVGKPVKILRDTGSVQSLICEKSLPASSVYSGSNVLVRGIGMGCLSLPLHDLYLTSDLVTGPATLGVCSHLPVDGVDVILGNDLAGGDVFPRPLVISEPPQDDNSSLAQNFPTVFPSCAVTRAQSRKLGDVLDLSESFLVDSNNHNVTPEKAEVTETCEVVSVPELKPILEVGREQLAIAQRTDPSLATLIGTVANSKRKPHDKVRYFWEGKVLMRRWRPIARSSLSEIQQIVLPQQYREPILKIAHEHVLSGHLGVTKTFKRVSRYFFWPGLKSAVSKFCRVCAACQIAGKPNQKLPIAPLRPIPVMHEPFERLLLDCVGPLPKSKSGYEYILSIMCTSTRFPEAIPLRSIKAHIIVRELIKFCTVFGLPKVIQTDQGTNFTSKLFTQTLTQFGIRHELSSAYHAQSQGAVERFHQTLKMMLRTYCLASGKDWAESLPFLMFAVREAEQESLGFSPADLVFGHTVRGPLKVLSEQLLAKDAMPISVLDYVSSFRERLHRARDLAREHLVTTQSKMKERYDKKSVSRSFQPNDEVLILLPEPGSALHARFTGPYSVKEKLSETDYVVRTPDRRRKTRVCHINMLKRFMRDSQSEPPCNPVTVSLPVAVASQVIEQDGKRLQNSAVLKDLASFLSHLEPVESEQIIQLMHRYSPLFSDVPGRTTVLEHDINVGSAKPIKQHSYRVNPSKRHIMKTEVEYMLQHGLAQHSQSPWSSPCLLVPKADGTYRFCTDFRKVNAVTKPDSFPLPRMEDCVDRVGSAKFVTKLDLLKGYWQVPLTARAAEVSAFVTPDYFLEYSVLAFGMRNAPATFQRLMHIVLGDVPNCDAYLDDIIVYTESWEDHLKTLERVFERLKLASLTLNLSKCEIGKATVTYLGKKVGHGWVKPVEAKVEAILKFPKPNNKRELRRFLGMSGYYRGFCRNFSAVVAPLTDLLSTARVFSWSRDCDRAFEAAKDLLSNAPVLAAPNFKLSFKLQVDASHFGAGAVLIQEDAQGIEHPVSYFSRKFSKCQLSYSTIEKEALALLWAVQHFEVYLGSSALPVIVYTDHNPLTFLSNMSSSNQRLLRWALKLQDFNLQIQHIKGKDNIVADALSRSVEMTT